MGKWLGRLMMIFGVSALPTAAASQAGLTDFWAWFQKNQAAYFALDPQDAPATKRLFDDLSAHMTEINPDLVFEFGPVIEGRRELVISAGGIKSAFPAVTALAQAAPSLPQWKITAFRPRRHPMNQLQVGSLKIDPDNVYVQIARDDTKLALRIFMPGYSDHEREKYGTIAYLLLDEALGEYDAETKVSGIDFQPLDTEPPDNSVTMSHLAETFDGLFAETVH